MTEQVFSDGLGQVTVVGGMVRLDFVAYSPTEKDAKGQYLPVFCQRIIMSPDGFLRSAEKIQEAARTLAKLAQGPREVPAMEPAAGLAATPAAPPELSNPPKRPFP